MDTVRLQWDAAKVKNGTLCVGADGIVDSFADDSPEQPGAHEAGAGA